MKTALRSLLLLALLAPALACHRDGGGAGTFPKAPVILISIDTLRSDHLPAYGYQGVETPAIDGLAKDGLVFERAYSHTPLTLPSHTSMLTGRLPTEHGVRDNVGYRFDGKKTPSLASVLHGAGYATGAAVSAYVLRPETGLSEGFDAYDAGIPVHFSDSLGLSQRPGGQTADAALAWVRTVKDKPFFLFLHLYEPHTPYAPPEPFASRYAGRPYDGEIAAADAVVGRVLDEIKKLDLYDDAVILLVSDHGEGLGEHGEQEHGIFLYREALQVPMILKLPGGRLGGGRVSKPAQIVDVFPTLLRLVGVEPPQEAAGAFPGRPLLDLRDAKAAERGLYAETFYPRLHFGWSELTSLIQDRFHYIHGPDPELYDLAADPGEKASVLPRERRAFAAMRQSLQGMERALVPPSAVDAETASRLASLGYASGTASTNAGEKLPDPKSRIATLKDFDLAMGLFAQGRYAESVPAFQRLLAESPKMADAWENLAQALTRLGRLDEALNAYEHAMEASGGASFVAVATGTLLLQMGRLDEARAHAELGLAGSPGMANSLLAQIEIARGRTDEAEKAARAALAAPGSRIAPLMTLAQVFQKQGRLDEALKYADEAAAELARTGAAGQAYAGIHWIRGDVLARLGREPEAEREFLQEIHDFPSDTRAYASLSLLYASQGRAEEAVAALRRMVDAGGSPAAYAEAVRTLRILGDPQGAAALLRHALAVHPGNPELRGLAGGKSPSAPRVSGE
ncbi:MAG: sulfatase-like hydrolase/transferase [Thermoanaerobaculia bacterium]